jgi:hypothetical protein
VPDQIPAPLTSFTPETITIQWEEPAANGNPISSYTIYIRESDEVTYSTELTSCDGSDPTIFANQYCIISSDTLQESPFNLPWGANVYAKLIATNVKGDSLLSDGGFGGVILRQPD